MNSETLKKRIDVLVKKAEDVTNTGRSDKSGIHWPNRELKAQVRVSALSFLGRTFGEDSAYYTDFERLTKQESMFERGLGILRSAQEEIHGGWLFDMKSLVAADIFADYLEMASHLNDEGYKDPAAVLAGSTLEEHLRRLCQKRGLSVEEKKKGKMIPLKADRLNADLAKASVYNILDQKNVTAWLDLRNKAAHGKYHEYNVTQVDQLIQSVREFIARNPA